jgi:hypothetical protein
MLADVPQMTWFADIKMPLWRFVDKMDGSDARPDPSEQWIWACTVVPGAAFSGVKRKSSVLLALARHP